MKKRLSDLLSDEKPPVEMPVNEDEGAKIRIYKTNHANDRAHLVAKAYVKSGCRSQQDAYQSVYGCKPKTALNQSVHLFRKPEMRAAVDGYLRAKDSDEFNLDKNWALNVWKTQIELNILDYLDGDGDWLSVKELKALPVEAQQGIKAINVNNREVLNKEGEVIGRVQNVHIELVDKQKALEHMARAQKWIANHELRLSVEITADDLMAACSRRLRQLGVDDIQGESEVISVEAQKDG